jgi:hypothetical protein
MKLRCMKIKQSVKFVSKDFLVQKSTMGNGFMNRFDGQLHRGRCRHKDAKRQTWCTRENFKNMYDAVYDKMV